MYNLSKVKFLSFGLKVKSGRSNGRITIPRRGYMTKRVYRYLDVKRVQCAGSFGVILKQNIYDPNRTAKIALLLYPNGVISYILTAKMIEAQTIIYNLEQPFERKEKGWSNYLKLIPLGTLVFNIEIFPGMGAKLIKAAGGSALLLKKEAKFKRNVLLKLTSGEHRLISKKAVASVGVVNFYQHFLRDYKKAGNMRLQGYRPRTRPSAMNPVDHPMGGRTRGGCAPQSKTGILSLGVLNKQKSTNNLRIVKHVKTTYKLK